MPPDRFAEAIRVLEADGFHSRVTHWNAEEITLKVPPFELEVDLHRALFAPGRYRLGTSAVFTRGRLDNSLFKAPVILPDPYDAVAHVIGHAAADHRISALPRVCRDIGLLAEKFRLNPETCARRLDASGLSRAARFVLDLIGTGSAFGLEVLALLPKDALSSGIAHAAAVLARRFPARSPLSIAAGCLINTSLPQAAQAVGASLANRLRFGLGLPLRRRDV